MMYLYFILCGANALLALEPPFGLMNLLSVVVALFCYKWGMAEYRRNKAKKNGIDVQK